VENGMLTIEGKHREERKHEDPQRKFLRTERVLQSVRRQLRLSSDVEQTPGKIKARYQDGVLKVRRGVDSVVDDCPSRRLGIAHVLTCRSHCSLCPFFHFPLFLPFF